MDIYWTSALEASGEILVVEGDVPVATVHYLDDFADGAGRTERIARMFVRALNSHDRLLEAAKELLTHGKRDDLAALIREAEGVQES